MINNFVFCCALPGAGKSTYIKDNFKDYIVVSADEIKKTYPDYDPKHPEIVHERSVQDAKQYIFDMCNSNKSYKVVLDGGGINNHYNVSIIDKVRKNSLATVTCLYFDTPVEVCIERISKRERKVPISEIYKKNQKLIGCLNKYKEVVDSIITINYFKNKYIILDMDGTIASYNKTIVDEDGNVDFVNGLHFKNSRPVKSIINYVKDHFDMTNVYIITACPNSIAWQEKNTWIDKYFPEVHITNRFFVGNKDWKHVFIKHLALKNKWKMNEICVIDDFHSTLQKCAKLGMNTVHPSNIESL